MKTYLKTFGRMFRRHLTRLVSVFLMVLVSIGFCAGIGMSTEKMRYSLHDKYVADNVSDLIVRGQGALAEEKLQKLYETFGEENVATGGVLEFTGGALSAGSAQIALEGVGEGVTRVYFSAKKADVNRAATLEERQTDGAIPVATERDTAQLRAYAPGESLTARISVQLPFLGAREETLSFAVEKRVESPLHFAVRDDPSMTASEDGYAPLESIFYLDGNEFSVGGMPLSFPVNEAYISVPALKTYTLFSSEYEKELERARAAAEQIFAEELAEQSAGVLTLHENFSFESFSAYADKIASIGYVFIVVFLLVTLLVVLATMTRLLEEERGQIACLATLGYSPARILVKYLLFALAGTLIGCVGAYFAGEGLSYIIYINFTWNFALPPYSRHAAPLFFILSASLVSCATLAATAIAGGIKLRETPAALLRPRVPKAGRKVILERIPLLWNRLSFKYKSTMRNVLRFKMRFAMTVVSVMASTALVLAGLAVLDCCLFGDIGTAAMIGVAIVVLVFAALLNAVVIYTLTNINISERNRELATLMVLGYFDGEVSSYIYREIYITSSVGIALGLPFGCLVCYFVFNVMSFGSIPGIGWYVWLLAPLLSLAFTALVTLMLRNKIVKIDMNESLKAIE